MSASTAITPLASSARTTTGSGAAVDLAEKTTAILYADLAAITGSGVLTITVKTSPNGTSGWTTVAPSNGAGGSLAFTAASAVGLQKVTFPGCEQYLRVDWSISNGATMTFSVFGSAFLVFAKPADLGTNWRAALVDVSDAETDKNLRRATDEIVSALDAQEYKGPFTAWGEDVAGTCRTLGNYYSLLDRGFKPSDSADPIVQGVADARAWIDLVAKGQRKPFGVVDSTTTEEEGGVYISTEAARGW
jgi:hypothetical protein